MGTCVYVKMLRDRLFVYCQDCEAFEDLPDYAAAGSIIYTITKFQDKHDYGNCPAQQAAAHTSGERSAE